MPDKGPTDKDISATLSRHLAAEASHDAEAAAACYVEDGWYEHLALGLRFAGREQVAAQYVASYQAMPDIAFVVDHEFIAGDTVVQTGTFTGTVTGEMLGLAPTGRRVQVPMTAEYGFRDGLIEHERILFDLATFADQAGLDIATLRAAVGHPDPAHVAAATVHRYAQAKSRADVEAALFECTDDFVLNTIPFRSTARGADEARDQLGLFFAIFPDYDVTIAGELASAHVVSCWGNASATMQGAIGPIAATGRRFDVPFSCVFPIRDAKIARENFHFDLATMAAQLGIEINELLSLLPTAELVS